MVDPAEVAVVVLAAGLSRRFGAADKLLAPLDGKPLAAHCIETLTAIPFGHRIAVCRNEPKIVALFEGGGFSVVLNEESARGQASSLALGVGEAQKRGAAFALICLADMPRVGASHLLAMLQKADPIMASAARPEEPPSPPALFAARHFPELMALTGDQGARALLRQATILVAPAGELADFDTPADFA